MTVILIADTNSRYILVNKITTPNEMNKPQKL